MSSATLPLDPSAIVTLVSLDGIEVRATVAAITKSVILRTMFADLGVDSSNIEGTSVPLWGVNGMILQHIIHWCEYHRDDCDVPEVSQSPERSEAYELFVDAPEDDGIDEWDSLLLSSMESIHLEQLLEAADYLEIPRLVSTVSEFYAHSLTGKDTETLRQMLHIKNDLTPGEESEIKDTANWIQQRFTRRQM
ncbi:Skp1 family, dimerization domain-containing protein [Poronia punctata]|nr:Skp1 family, dimerization domain-containing protein [Poronia punctata]